MQTFKPEHLEAIQEWLSENEPEITVILNEENHLVFSGKIWNFYRGKKEERLAWDNIKFTITPNSKEPINKLGEYYLRNRLMMKLINHIYGTNHDLPNGNIGREWGIFPM